MAEGKEKEEYRRFQDQRTQNSVSLPSYCTALLCGTDWAGSIINSTLISQFFVLAKTFEVSSLFDE